MLLILAIVLFLAWIGAFALFKVTSAMIHVILVVALVAFIMSFFRRSAPI